MKTDCIAALLLENRESKQDYWGDIAHLGGKPCSKRIANKFLLCCLLDWQMHTDVAWRNGERLVEKILGDPDDVWRVITSVAEVEWESRRPE